MNTASKNCGCEVDKDFAMCANLLFGYTLKTPLKGDMVLYWGEGERAFCIVLTFCCTSKVTYKLSFLAHIITGLQNKKGKGGKFLKKLWCCLGGSIGR